MNLRETFIAFTAEINVINGGILPSCPFNGAANICFQYLHGFLNGRIVTVIPVEDKKRLTKDEVQPKSHDWKTIAKNTIPLIFATIIGIALRFISLYSSNVRLAITSSYQWAHLQKLTGIHFFDYFFTHKEDLAKEDFKEADLPKTDSHDSMQLIWDIVSCKGKNLLEDENFKYFIKDFVQLPAETDLGEIRTALRCLKKPDAIQRIKNTFKEDNLLRYSITRVGLVYITHQQSNTSDSLQLVLLYEEMQSQFTQEGFCEYIPTEEGLKSLLALQKPQPPPPAQEEQAENLDDLLNTCLDEYFEDLNLD